MSTLKIFFIIMCLMISQLAPFSPLLLIKYDSKSTGVSTPVDSPESIGNTGGTEAINENEYNITGLLTVELDGYCTIDIPQSHWQSVSSELNTETQKYFKYKDNRTRILMGYVTNIKDETDIPGYIVQEVAKVNMVTNSKQEVNYNNTTWMMIPSVEPIDGSNVVVWYKLSSDETSAFWMKATKDLEIDEVEFQEVIDIMIKSYNMYYIGSSIFDTPTTGIYTDTNNNNNTPDGYKENNDDNTVFQGRGGFIEGADISDNWTDMEIIIDDAKFKLPCTIEDFYEAGYEIITGKIGLDSTIRTNSNLKLSVANNIGTVIELTATNDSQNESCRVVDATITALKVDSDKFLSVADVTNIKKSYDAEENDNTLEDENEENKEEIQEEVSNTEEMKDNIKNTEEDTVEYTANHKLIIAGGATWDVYTDDIKELYGTCTTSPYDNNTVYLRYVSGTNIMTIRIGKINGIKSIYLSVNGN